jgi:hypothetical protein
MTEQDRYGTTKAAAPIPVVHDRRTVTSTPNPTAAPNRSALRAYHRVVRKDITARRKERRGTS